VAHRFEDASTEHLLALISDMIDRLIAHNDQIPLHPDGLTRFHSRSPPSISVYDYLVRIVKYANVESSCLLITLHYIDQICSRLPKFTITSLTIHRFIIASVTVASKALCDVFRTNSRYAQVGGIKVNELNLLEREFLNIIDWRLFCTGELLQEYYANLVRTHSKGAYKLDIPPSPQHNPVPSPVSLPNDLDADEVDSTAHVTSSRAASVVTTIGDDMRSESESVTVEDDDENPKAATEAEGGRTPHQPNTVYSFSAVVSPQSAAKRRAEGTDSLGTEERPRGRRKLDS